MTATTRRTFLLGSAGLLMLTARGGENRSGAGAAPSGPLGISAIPDQDPELLSRLYPVMAKRFAGDTGIEVVYRPVTDYTAVVRALEIGDIRLAWMGGLTGVQARARIPGTTAIAQRERIGVAVVHRCRAQRTVLVLAGDRVRVVVLVGPGDSAPTSTVMVSGPKVNSLDGDRPGRHRRACLRSARRHRHTRHRGRSRRLGLGLRLRFGVTAGSHCSQQAAVTRAAPTLCRGDGISSCLQIGNRVAPVRLSSVPSAGYTHPSSSVSTHHQP